MMQLATSPRPHPPPVPPRPSRQVVAEALKRSTRLPCPTRQAPPPPNTRPWRSEDHVSESRECRDGRTLVYKSATLSKESNASDCEEVVRSASEPRDETPRRDPTSPRRSGSYGNVDREYRDEESKRIERYEAPNYQNKQAMVRESPEKKSRISQANGKVCDDREHRDGRPNGERTRLDEEFSILTTKNTIDSTSDKTMKDSCRSNNDEAPLDAHATENVLENLEKSEDIPRAPIAKENTSSLAKNSDDPKSSSHLTSGISTTPTRITSTLKVTNDENSQLPTTTDDECLCAEENKNGDTTYNGTAMTTISSDDCTTVVVIDEPQRKISFNEDNIQHQDWLEAGVRYSSTKITLPYGDETYDRTNEQSTLDDRHHEHDHEDYNHEDRNDPPAYIDNDFASIRERIAMSSLQGLPPLPRSLSGFNLNEGRREAGEPPPPPTRSSSKTPKNVKSTQPSSSRPSPPGRQLTTLDTQLAILRKEMFGLRQLDLSLLSQLWSLNESIQEFRQLLQEQEDRAPSPSPSSEEGDDTSYGSHPPPPPRRPAPLLHHHRPPRPPRPLRPPASDESPSSEEYGAV